MIKSWSHSRLTEFESCNYRAKLKIIDKIPEPEKPLPPGKTEHANDRGNRVHTALELHIGGNGPFPVEASKFKAEIASLKAKYAEGKVSLEGEWGFDRAWEPCDYNDKKKVWLRVKCDAVVHLSDIHITVIDFKTGRKDGNEIKHAEQVQLYAMCAFILFPKVKVIDVELWYLDQDDMTQVSKLASKWMAHLKLFDNRGNKMTTETVFKPNPNVFSCKYCPYNGNACEFGIDKNNPVVRRATSNMHAAKAVRRKGESR